MPKPLSRYPDGAGGVALLLLRISCGLVSFPALGRLVPIHASGWPAATLSLAVTIALVAGFGTRAAALLLCVVLAATAFPARGEVLLFILGSAGGSGALALLGPGAYSIDAHRFGRRVIRLEPRSPDRGGSG